MIIIRKSNNEIKTYMDALNGHVLEEGETIEEVNMTAGEYAKRLVLSIGGVSGLTVGVTTGAPDIKVDVSCPGKSSVDLMVNNLKETITLKDGMGSLMLSCAVPGVFVISPADKTQYCAGGQSTAVLEVV